MLEKLRRYGWDASREAEFTACAREGLAPARIIGEVKDGYALMTGGGQRPGILAGRHRAEEDMRPAVGDWAACFDGGDGPLRIEALLKRKSLLSRGRAGTGMKEQVLAANVDVVFLVMSLDADFNLRRLERHLTAVWESGARPVVLLSKLDAAKDPAGMRLAAEAAAPGADVLALSARTGEGVPELLARLRPAETAALLGSSGVGKSTLTNLLLGREVQAVREVRESDSKGRHTTTGRRLFLLASGALLIDTPGMREFRLWEDEDGGLDRAFKDVSALAAACRFGDCRHKSEPGCAVLEALASGRLSRERLESWLKLGRELDFAANKKDKAKRSNAKKRWKKIHLQLRRRRKL